MQVIRWRQNDSGFKVGDDGRIKIQQDFLKAVIDQTVTPSNLLNISKIATVFQESVETDLTFQNVLWFGQQAILGGLEVEDVTFFTMPFQYASAFTRVYSKQLNRPYYLSYVVPAPEKLLGAVNEHLSPYADPFTLNDLDIMYANADGSVGSTGGFVEDEPAALPPDLSPYQKEEPKEPEAGEPPVNAESETEESAETEGLPADGTEESETAEGSDAVSEEASEEAEMDEEEEILEDPYLPGIPNGPHEPIS